MWPFGNEIESTDLNGAYLIKLHMNTNQTALRYALESDNGIRWNIFCSRVFNITNNMYSQVLLRFNVQVSLRYSKIL